MQREADELNLSNVDYIMKAMQHIKQHHLFTDFHIRFMQKPALWWKRLYELALTLDDEIFEAPVALKQLKRILTDTALDKLTNPVLIEELSEEHLIFAKQEALKSFSTTSNVSFVKNQTYRDLGFEIDNYGWVQQIDPSMQRPRGRGANQKSNQPTTLKTGGKSTKKGWAIDQRASRPY